MKVSPSFTGGSLGQYAFLLFLFFTVSVFCRLPSRIPPLGVVRLDLLLVALISILIVLIGPQPASVSGGGANKWLLALVGYVLLTVPLVQWPGSVFRFGLPDFIKAAVFYYFAVSLLTTRQRFLRFVAVYIGCQTFRVLEPTYLHVTQGYWGSRASMEGWEFMDRLSGAPHDIINPNGLAYVIVSTLPFYHYLAPVSWKTKLLYAAILPSFIYALILTGSRSGMVALAAIFIAIIWRSKSRVLLLAIVLPASLFVLSRLDENLLDRYRSIYSTDTKNAATAQGRLEGMSQHIRVGMHKPIVGHGLGTSSEANANFGTDTYRAHNLYIEAFQEVGLVGLILVVGYLVATTRNSLRLARERASVPRDPLTCIGNGMLVWVGVNLVFSLVSYGLSEPYWYVFGGLLVVAVRLSAQERLESGDSEDLHPLDRARLEGHAAARGAAG